MCALYLRYVKAGGYMSVNKPRYRVRVGEVNAARLSSLADVWDDPIIDYRIERKSIGGMRRMGISKSKVS